MDSVDAPFRCGDRAVYVPPAETLVLADLHLGRGAASNVDAPLGDGADAVARLEALLEQFDPDEVVVAGDLLHSFSRIPRGVAESLDDLVRAVADADASLVVTPGNHDTMLAELYAGPAPDEYRLADDETVVLHGHEPPESDAVRYIVGHDHPALSVEGRKHPCFLYGPEAYEGNAVLQLPAFTRLAPGSTVNGMAGRDFASPLVRNADVFHPAIRDVEDGETLWFPPLGECRRLL